MKTTRIALLALALAGAAAGAGHAATSVSAGIHVGSSGRTSVDVGFFYDDLAPYGNWVERPNYGWVWRPRAVASSWRPYQSGHWAWTDYGWTWISTEPYGWATYHYGRWYDDPDYGWEWVPGDEWAPAWVDWQASDDYVGWAPLPPSYGSDDYDGGYSRQSRYSSYLEPDDYFFVPQRNFLSLQVVSYAVPRRDCGRIYHQSRNYTSYRRYNNGFFNQGVPVDRIQQRIGRRVPRYQVADMGSGFRHRGARIAQNRVEVFRPRVQRTRVAPPPNRPNARRSVITRTQVTRRTEITRRPADVRQPRQGQIRQQDRRIRDARPQARQQGRQERQVTRQGRQVTRQGRQVTRQERQVTRQERQRGREVRPQVRQRGREVRQERQVTRQERRTVREVRPQSRQNGRVVRQERQVTRQERRTVREVRPQARQERQVRQQGRPAAREVRQQGRQDRQQRMQERGGRGQGRPQGRQERQRHGRGGQ